MNRDKSHNSALDGLRCFAFLCVFLYHAGYYAVGSQGVTLFFVLSGFLIGRNLLKERNEETTLRARLQQFYIRRTLRIFPLYYLALLAFALLIYLVPMRFYSTHHELLCESLYLTNFWRFVYPQTADISAHFWTLAIEEQFYIVAPLMIFTLPLVWLVRGFTAYVLLNIGLRLGVAFTPLNANYGLLSWYNFVFLGLGVRLALLHLGTESRSFSRAMLNRLGPICAGLVALFSLPYLDHFPLRYLGWFDFVVALASAWLVLGVWEARFPAAQTVLGWKPFVALGAISYGLYVWHWPILFVLGSYVSNPLSRAVLGFCLTVLVACASWYGLEKPFLKLKPAVR